MILRLLGEIVRNPPQTDGTIDALRAALQARSLVSMEPIRALVERELVPGADRRRPASRCASAR